MWDNSRRKSNVFPDFLWGNGFIQAIAHKQRLAQIIEAETAARALHGVFPLTVATNHTPDPLGGDTVGVVHHFHEDKLAVSAVGFVHVQHCMGSGAGHGYGAEAFAAAADWALFQLSLARIKAKCYKENAASYKMLSACMRPAGEDETFFYFEKTV